MSVRSARQTERVVLTLGYLVDVLVPCNKLGRDRDARSRLDLISGQHPDLDTSIAQKFDCRLDLILQLVFYTSQAEQFKIPLKILRHDRRHPLVSILQLNAGFMMTVFKCLVRLLIHALPANDERGL